MVPQNVRDAPIVRHFRQILLWPFEIMPARADQQIQTPWQHLAEAGAVWGEIEDEFAGDGFALPRAEWLSADGTVLAVSDYENRETFLAHVDRYRAPAIASRWAFLLTPMVPHHTDLAGATRYRPNATSRTSRRGTATTVTGTARPGPGT